MGFSTRGNQSWSRSFFVAIFSVVLCEVVVVVVKAAAEERRVPMTLDRVALTRDLKAVSLFAGIAAADEQRDSKSAFITSGEGSPCVVEPM
jgi:hypothetical protein